MEPSESSDEEDVQVRELAILHLLHSKLDVGAYTVKVLVERVTQVSRQGCTCVVHIPSPGKVCVWKVYKAVCFNVFHGQVGHDH